MQQQQQAERSAGSSFSCSSVIFHITRCLSRSAVDPHPRFNLPPHTSANSSPIRRLPVPNASPITIDHSLRLVSRRSNEHRSRRLEWGDHLSVNIRCLHRKLFLYHSLRTIPVTSTTYIPLNRDDFDLRICYRLNQSKLASPHILMILMILSIGGNNYVNNI